MGKPKRKYTKKPKIETKPAEAEYVVTLTLGNSVLEGKGPTFLDALANLPKPVKIVTKGTLKATDGTRTLEQLYYPQRLKRLFYNRYFLQIQAAQLERVMK